MTAGVVPGLLHARGPAAAGVDGRALAFHLHPDVAAVMVVLGIGYWWMVSTASRRGEVTTRRQMVWWGASLAALWAFAAWPVHDLAEHYSYAVHMLEHEVFILVAAPMMLLGTPEWLLRRVVIERSWYPVVGLACRPGVAIATFTTVMMASHWPVVVNATTRSEPFHFGAHLVIFGSALALWIPLVNRATGLTCLSRPTKILYLFAMSIPSTLPTLWLIFSTGVVYKAYAGGPEYLGFGAIADQDWAGAIMGAFGAAFIWILAGYHFFAWYAEEQHDDRREHPDAARRSVQLHA